MKYKFLEHTADVKFQAFGKTLEEVFENSALAMFSIMHKGNIGEATSLKINVSGKDKENLLYNFLEELLFLFETQNFFLKKINKIKIKNNHLTAEIIGGNSEKISFKTDIKAVTYNEMFIKKQRDKFIAQVVLDV